MNYLEYAQCVENKNATENYVVSANFDERCQGIFSEISPSEVNKLVSSYPSYGNLETEKILCRRYGLNDVVLGGGVEGLIVRVNRYISDKKKKTGIIVPAFYRTLENLYADYIFESQLNIATIIKYDVIWLANPNPLTGTIWTASYIISLAKTCTDTLFLIDEACMATVDNENEFSLQNKIYEWSNIIVFRSFSKLHGLAGLRIGFAFGNEKVLSELRKNESIFQISSYAEKVLRNVFENEELFNILKMDIKKNREHVVDCLSNKTDIKIIKTNFNVLFLTNSKGCIINDLLSARIAGLDLNTIPNNSITDGARITIHSSEYKSSILITAINKL